MSADTKAHAAEVDGDWPTKTGVVIIGAGVVGVTAALYLKRWGVPVVVCEKGRIAGEQSSRNWGWIRKQGRDVRELPLMLESQQLWPQLAAQVEGDIGFKQCGSTYLAETEAELAHRAAWLESAKGFQLDSRLLSGTEVDEFLDQSSGRFLGGLHTPSDMHAEPRLAVPAIARLAAQEGVRILEQTAVRGLDRAGGRVRGVVTERGRIACDSVILAGGVWCRPLLENEGSGLAQLAVQASVQRTTEAPAIADGPVGATGASIRRRRDGGYTVARSGAARFDIIPAAFAHLAAFLPIARQNRRILKLRLGRAFVGPLGRRRWTADQASPFEALRVFDPIPDRDLLDDVMATAKELFPQLAEARPAERWSGMIDVTPDEVPAIGPVAGLPGLILATGLSGHGFGIGPGVGYLAAQLASGREPIVDPAPFRPERFSRRPTRAA